MDWHTIAFTAVKGGVGKSTSAINTAMWLAMQGYPVVLLDLDPQANATFTVLGNITEDERDTIFDVVINQRNLQDVLQETQVPGLRMAAGTLALADTDLKLAAEPGRENRLAKAMKKFIAQDKTVSEKTGYIILDTPPNINLLMVNALVACDGYITPISLAPYPVLGIALQNRTLSKLRSNLDIPIPQIGVLATLKDNTNESRRQLEELQGVFKQKMFQTVIPRNIVVAEASDKMNLFEYAPESAGAQAYAAFSYELVERVESGIYLKWL